MAFPGKKTFKAKEGLCHITAALMNRIINMLDSLEIVMTAGQDHASIDTPALDGTGWKFNIPKSKVDTTGATKWMVYTITDDTTTPPTGDFDWTRAHA
jgi:hypothetical protein